MTSSAESRTHVIAVRVDPATGQRLRLLTEASGRTQSYVVQQLIERGIEAMEAQWLPPEAVVRIRRGELPAAPSRRVAEATTGELFADGTCDEQSDRPPCAES